MTPRRKRYAASYSRKQKGEQSQLLTVRRTLALKEPHLSQALSKSQSFCSKYASRTAIASMANGLKKDSITATNDNNKALDVLLADHINENLRIPPLGSIFHSFRLHDECPPIEMRLMGECRKPLLSGYRQIGSFDTNSHNSDHRYRFAKLE